MDIGVLGGTFDPVHIGHLIIAEEVRIRLGLSQVLFVPAGRPWLKEDRKVSAPEHRVHMVRLAISSNPLFRLSTVDVDRAGPSYAIDTVEDLQGELGEEARLFYILGWDALSELPLWKEPGRIVEKCHLVAVGRPGSSPPDLARLGAAIPGACQRIILLETPLIGISSTDIRRRVAQGLSIRYLVPDPVEAYIRETGLYRVE